MLDIILYYYNSCDRTQELTSENRRKGKKGKGKAYLYSAFIANLYSKLHHTCLYLANVRQMAPPERQTSDSSRYSFIDPGRMKG